MKKTDYEKWKDGENVCKMPWVIEYYKNITDINQYKFGLIVEKRISLVIGLTTFIFGLILGFSIGGMLW